MVVGWCWWRTGEGVYDLVCAGVPAPPPPHPPPPTPSELMRGFLKLFLAPRFWRALRGQKREWEERHEEEEEEEQQEKGREGGREAEEEEKMMVSRRRWRKRMRMRRSRRRSRAIHDSCCGTGTEIVVAKGASDRDQTNQEEKEERRHIFPRY